MDAAKRDKNDKAGANQKESGAPNEDEEEEELDWRLQGPSVKKPAPVFKPGTSTWDTDDVFEAKRKAPKLKDGEAPKAVAKRQGIKPADWWMQEYKPVYEETVQTVGHAARAMTSTIAPVHTKNERVMKLKHRYSSSGLLSPLLWRVQYPFLVSDQPVCCFVRNISAWTI